MPPVIVFFPFGEFWPDGPVELEVLGFVDNAHAAPAKLGENLVVGYALADHREPLGSTKGVKEYALTIA